jgi:hypothetical protein
MEILRWTTSNTHARKESSFSTRSRVWINAHVNKKHLRCTVYCALQSRGTVCQFSAPNGCVSMPRRVGTALHLLASQILKLTWHLLYFYFPLFTCPLTPRRVILSLKAAVTVMHSNRNIKTSNLIPWKQSSFTAQHEGTHVPSTVHIFFQMRSFLIFTYSSPLGVHLFQTSRVPAALLRGNSTKFPFLTSLSCPIAYHRPDPSTDITEYHTKNCYP